jgi:hypothetical protein
MLMMKGISLALFFIPVLSSLILSGCATTDETDKLAEMGRQNTVLQEKNTQLAAELTEKKALTSRLQIKLLEKDAEINRLAAMQQNLSRESARNKARTHPPKNKAEAVALLAETETTINAAKELIRNAADRQVLAGLDQLMEEGRTAIEQGYFDKAYTRATEASERIRKMQLEKAATIRSAPVSSFSSPMPMQIAKKSKLRKNPGIHAQVLKILEPGTMVKATRYQGHWVKIQIDDQEPGWIYYSLLSVPEI